MDETTQLIKVKEKFGVKRFGTAFDIWNVMQKSGVFLNELRLVDPSFIHLPRTDFSEPNADHSSDIRDIKLFADAARDHLKAAALLKAAA